MDYDIDKLVAGMDFTTNQFVTCSNGLMLTNGEINTLKRYNINYMQCSSLKDVLYLVENAIEEVYDSDDIEELDLVAASIAERDYYQNTNK